MRALYQNENVMLVGVKIPIELWEHLIAVHAYCNAPQMQAPKLPMNKVIDMEIAVGIDQFERHSLGMGDVVEWEQAQKYAREFLSDPFATNGIWEVE